MAPEVIGSNKYTEKADIFSFGVLLVETYSLRPPYSEEEFLQFTQAQLMYKIVNEALRPPTNGLPDPLVQLARECWDTIPGQRPTFIEIIVRLKRLESLEETNYRRSSDLSGVGPNYTTFHELLPAADQSDNEETPII